MYINYNNFRLNENLSDAKELLIKRYLIIKKRDKMISYLMENNFKPEELANLNMFELSNLCFISYLSKRGFNKEEMDAKKDACDTFTSTKKLNKELETSGVEFSKRPDATNDDKKELRQFIFTKKEIEETETEAKKDIEKNPQFTKLRDLLIADKAEKSIGFFTRLLFSDVSTKEKEIEFDKEKNYKAVISLYNDIKELAPYIGDLPDATDRKREDGAPFELQDYVALKDSPLEKLMDDIELLKLYVNVKKFFVNRLSKKFRDEFKASSKAVKDKVKVLTKSFSEFGLNEKTGIVNAQENKNLQNKFFEDQAGDKDLDGLLRRAVNYIKTLNNKNMSKFLIKIADVNNRLGEASGVKIVYPGEQENPKPDILIIEVKSFLANQALNTATTHCIAKWETYWDDYISDKTGAKQYYIYNFGLDPDDNRSVIGVTIMPNGEIDPRGSACQDKHDNHFPSTYNMSFENYMEKILGIPFKVLEPINNEERQERLMKMEASRGITFPGLDYVTLKSYLDRGADPNYKSVIPLINAIKDNRIDCIKLLLERGADPNIGQVLGYVNNKESTEKGLEIAKILIENDPGANPSINDNALLIAAVSADKYNFVKYLLYYGADPNLKTPIHKAKNIEMIRLLVENGGKVSTENFMAVIKSYKDLKYLLDHGANPSVDKSKILQKAVEQIDDEQQCIQIIDLLIKHGARITDGNKRVFKTAGKFFKLKVLKYLLDELKKIDPSKLTIEWFGTISFELTVVFEDNKEKARIILSFLENYSGFDLKEFLYK